jgi:hypothetical protein
MKLKGRPKGPRKRLTDTERADLRRAKANRNRRCLRLQVIEAYGAKCQCPGCDEDHIEFLALDHIHGGGNAHRKSLTGRSHGAGDKVYRWLKRQGFPKDSFRLLCHNCNQSRGSYGYCPHEQRGPAGPLDSAG